MILQTLMPPYQTNRLTKVMDRILSIIFIVLNNQLAKYAKFHITYNDPALVLETTPLKIKERLTSEILLRMSVRYTRYIKKVHLISFLHVAM